MVTYRPGEKVTVTERRGNAVPVIPRSENTNGIVCSHYHPMYCMLTKNSCF